MSAKQKDQVQFYSPVVAGRDELAAQKHGLDIPDLVWMVSGGLPFSLNSSFLRSCKAKILNVFGDENLIATNSHHQIKFRI